MTPAPIPVLLYHGVDWHISEGFRPWVMGPDRFEAHLDRIVEEGFTSLTVSALRDAIAAGDPLPERCVALTFDDGLADFAAHAWPALKARGLAATLYVVIGYVGRSAEHLASLGEPCPQMLSWDQIRQLDAEGCEIGSHSQTHPQLDCLRHSPLQAEISQSRKDLAVALGHPVRSFAYPHGYHGSRVRRAVIDAGYDSACAVREALSSRDDDPYAIARHTLLHDASVEALAHILSGRSGPIAPFPEKLRTKGWRTYRRLRHHIKTGFS